jgi:hypothetical protein
MEKYLILRRIRLTPKHESTGNTRHFHGGTPIPSPKELLMVKYDGDPGFYLIHLDESGNELTDTYHDTLEDAFAQAAWEFQIDEGEWENEG